MKAEEIDALLEAIGGREIASIVPSKSATFGTKRVAPILTLRFTDGSEFQMSIRRATLREAKR